MDRCTTCGQALRAGAYWCEACATRVQDMTAAPVAPPPAAPAAAPPPLPPRTPPPAAGPAPLPPARPRPRTRNRPAAHRRNPPTRRGYRRGVGGSIMGWIVAAFVLLSMAGGAINSLGGDDDSSGTTSGFDFPTGNQSYDSPSGLYSVTFPTSGIAGAAPQPMPTNVALTPSLANLSTERVTYNLFGNEYSVDEVTLPDARPPEDVLVTEHCEAIGGGEPMEADLAGRRAWRCQGLQGNETTTETYTFVGPTLLIVRGVENAAVPIFSYQSVVDSIVIHEPD